MKSENNGKIAIAIIAMFVVALSVVGFTYAYFTARVQGNEADKSVEVTAGKLEIKYTKGNKIVAQNLVPGWVSDGKHFYDPQYSKGEEVTGQTGVYKITAVSTDNHATKSDGTTPTDADGIETNATFTIQNTADNAGDNTFVIRLKDVTNGLDTADQPNLYVALYETGTAEPLWIGNLVATSALGQTIVSTPITLGKADTAAHNYEVELIYANEDAEQKSKNVGVVATLEVVPVVKSGSNYVDETGTKVTLGATSTVTRASLDAKITN